MQMWQGSDEDVHASADSKMERISEAEGSHRGSVVSNESDFDFGGLLIRRSHPDLEEPLHRRASLDPSEPNSRASTDAATRGLPIDAPLPEAMERGAGIRKDVRGGKGEAAAKKNLVKTMAAARKKWEVKTSCGHWAANVAGIMGLVSVDSLVKRV